jgi:hypothetical protein
VILLSNDGRKDKRKIDTNQDQEITMSDSYAGETRMPNSEQVEVIKVNRQSLVAELVQRHTVYAATFKSTLEERLK